MKRLGSALCDHSDEEGYLRFLLSYLKERFEGKKGGIFLGDSLKGKLGRELLFLARKEGLSLSEVRPFSREGCAYRIDAYSDGLILNPADSAFIDFYNSLKGKKIALEVPSGISPSNGMSEEGKYAVSDVTLSYAPLCGLYLQDGLDASGERLSYTEGDGEVSLLGEKDFKGILPPSRRNTNKGDSPKCAIVGGSSLYPGALFLSLLAEGAYRFGSGYTYVASTPSILKDAIRLNPQALPFPLKEKDGFLEDDPERVNELCPKVSSVLFGNGVGTKEGTYLLLKDFLENLEPDKTLVVDADGLNLLSLFGMQSLSKHACRLILTPHLKEFSRLSGKSVPEIQSDPVTEGGEFARKYGAYLVLKSASTLLFSPDGTVLLSPFGNEGLAKAGSGDLLAGLTLGSSLVLKDPLKAASLACYVLGKSAEKYASSRSARSLTYQDVLDGAGTVLLELEK